MSEEKAGADRLLPYPENGTDPALRSKRSLGGGAVVVGLSLLLCFGVVAMATYCTVQSIRNESRVRALELEIERLQRRMTSLPQSGMDDEYTADGDVYSDNDGGDDADNNSGDDTDQTVADANDFVFDDDQIQHGVTSSRNRRSASRKGKKNGKKGGNKKRKVKRQKKGRQEKLDEYIENKIKEASGLAAIHLDGGLTHNSEVMARLRSSAREYQEYRELDGRLYQQGFVTNKEIMAFWERAPWTNNNKSHKVYSFNKTEGSVTVKQDGVYFIYAQIMYRTAGDAINLQVHVNDVIAITCREAGAGGFDVIEQRHAYVDNQPYHVIPTACSTSGLVRLSNGDRISLWQRYVYPIMLEKPATFWGIIRIH